MDLPSSVGCRTVWPFVGASAFLLGVVAFAPTVGAKPKVKFHADWATFPSARYAAMTGAQCRAELTKRQVTFTSVDRAPGVLAPVRFPKGIGGVVYRTEVAAHERDSNPYEVFDCRLGLAMTDFSKILRTHDVDEVVMFSAWRPPGKRWPEGKLGTRHPGGLAMDAARFGKKPLGGEAAKTWLDVKRDFGGKLGTAVCGEGAQRPSPATPAAKELRSIVCEAVDQHIFTVVLTPNYDGPHKNHLHLEVTPGVQWHLVR